MYHDCTVHLNYYEPLSSSHRLHLAYQSNAWIVNAPDFVRVVHWGWGRGEG
jgi:hypothetical protein